MQYDVQIVGPTVITPNGRFTGTIAVRHGQFAAFLQEPSRSATRSIDATGLFALPGMLDQHVHFMDPGSTEREDFITGSSAAAVGGVTMLVEHTHSHPILTAAELQVKRAYLRDRSLVDFGLTAHVFPDTLDSISELWGAGIAMFKAFTCTTHGVPALFTDDLLRFFKQLAQLRAPVLMHCEDEFVTEDNEHRLRTALRTDFGIVPEWRSPEAELLAVNTVALLARLTGAIVTIAHASHPAVLQLADRERLNGAPLLVESCPQYFYLSEDDVIACGPTRKFTPPARLAADHAKMWAALRHGSIDIISSDHAPSTLVQKHTGNIWECPFGLPGVETTLSMLLHAAAQGWISLEQIAQVYSSTPARLLSLYPRKGAIRIGADADLVLVDMSAERVLHNEDVVSKAGWTPYDGMRIRGFPVMTLLRGTVVAENGKVMAVPGTGQFIAGPGNRSYPNSDR